MHDLKILTGYAIIITCVYLIPFRPIQIFFTLLIIIWWILLWIDAVIFYLFAFEINLKSIAYFFKNPKATLHYSTRTNELLDRFIWMPFLIPIIFLTFLAILFIPNGFIGFVVSLPIVLVVIISLIRKFNFSSVLSFFVLTGALVLIIISNTIVSNFIVQFPLEVISISAGILLVGSILLLIFRNKLPTAIFNSKSLLGEFLREVNLKPIAGVVLDSTHLDKCKLQLYHQVKSEKFGTLKNSNVILFVIESLRAQLQDYFSNSEMIKEMKHNAVIGENHYAICPNTNQFIEHFYGANYPSHLSYPFLPILREQGYQTALISSSNFNFWNTRDLLNQASFENCWDSNILAPLSGHRGDEMMLDSMPLLENFQDDKPFFLHFHSEQTHYPYYINDNKKFNRFKGTSNQSRYLNALDESLNVFHSLLKLIEEKLPMDNTLLIFTGDHGEAFGEFGYKAHSNSTINAQTLVPFIMKHPNLNPAIIQNSSHFDAMPTILDLLGFEYNSEHAGSSIFNENIQSPKLLYSQTRKANAPANLCAIIDDKKIMIDRVMGHYLKMTPDEKKVEKLNTSELDYYQTLFYRMAEERGLLEK